MIATWTEFKSLIDSNQVNFKELPDPEGYKLLGYDGAFEVECLLIPGRATPEEITDYETNYQDTARTRIGTLNTETGGIATSPKFAPDGWYQKVHELEFTSAKLNSIEDEKLDLTQYGYGTLKFYDASNNELTTQSTIDSDCVLTILDWTPTHDISVFSGYVKQVVTPTTRVKVWGIGSPHVPAAQGGTQVFVDGTNLEFESPGQEIGIDGVNGTILPYTELVPGSGLYANTLRLQVWTPDSPGTRHRIQFKVDLFVPPGS